jgi:hypothetical protein
LAGISKAHLVESGFEVLVNVSEMEVEKAENEGD